MSNAEYAGIAGIAFVFFCAFLGAVMFHLLHARGKHSTPLFTSSRDFDTGIRVGVHNLYRSEVAPVPAESHMADPEISEDTRIEIGWASQVEYFADVAQVQADINSGWRGVAEWLPARFRKENAE